MMKCFLYQINLNMLRGAWSITACIIAIVYGLRFDILYTEKQNRTNQNNKFYESQPCWNITLKLQIESELTVYPITFICFLFVCRVKRGQV